MSKPSGRDACDEIEEAPENGDVGDAETLQRLRDLTRRQALLLETMRALTSTLVLEDVLDLAARSAAEAMGVSSADINVYSAAENTMTEVAYWALEVTPEDEAYTGSSILLDERPFYYPHVADPMLVERQLDDPDFAEAERVIAEEWGELSGLVAPLLYGGQLIGLMGCMEKRRKRRFTDEDKELFRLLTVPAALAIHNAQTYQHEEVRNRRLVNLLGAAQKVAGALDRDEVARCIRQEATVLFPTRSCTADVCFTHAPGEAPAGSASAPSPVHEAPPRDELVATALQSRAATRSAAGAIPPRLVVPLVQRGAAVGYVDLHDNSRAAFSDSESEFVQILVTQAETALENARLYGELERQAITDGLTGLYNQRYFYDRLRQEFTRAQRLGTAFSLVMLDLDDFKLVNDHHGHQVGDEVLRGVARLLLGTLRSGVDLAARYGGEEFAVILPSVGPEAEATSEANAALVASVSAATHDHLAAGIAERIRAGLDQAEFAVNGCENPVRITLSGGVARFPGDADDSEGLVRAADKALYLAKRLGKNRVESFG